MDLVTTIAPHRPVPAGEYNKRYVRLTDEHMTSRRLSTALYVLGLWFRVSNLNDRCDMPFLTRLFSLGLIEIFVRFYGRFFLASTSS